MSWVRSPAAPLMIPSLPDTKGVQLTRLICALIAAATLTTVLFSGLPDQFAPTIIETYLISGVAILYIVLSYFSAWVKVRSYAVLVVLAYACTLWGLHFAYIGQMRFDDGISLLITLIAFNLIFRTTKQLATYNIFYVLCLVLVLSTIPNPQLQAFLYVVEFASVGTFMFFVARARIVDLASITAGKQSLETLFEQSTDALLVVEVETLKILSCNNKATQVFDNTHKDRIIDSRFSYYYLDVTLDKEAKIKNTIATNL